jgi:uncharacterized protein (UPF0276 family)
VVGIGLRAPHYAALIERRPPLAFLEIHAENFFADGGAALAWLDRFAALYPMSVHGVGLSLGSADALDRGHLARLRSLVSRVQPRFVSEHLSWSSIDGKHVPDLLPLPFTEAAAAHLAARIGEAQDFLGRRILVENVAAYVRVGDGALAEWQFVADVVKRSGCGLLLDVNNVYVNAANHGFEAATYLDAIDGASVEEIHLAGFEREGALLIDTHAAPVASPVWTLYRELVARIGARDTLIEWDAAIPPLEVLLGEARTAARILEGCDTAAEIDA